MPNKLLELSPYSVDGLQTPGFDYERFQDKLDTLPGNLIDFLLDVTPPDFIQALTQKYTQLSTQGQNIARLVRDVVVGDVFIGDMPNEISRRLGIDPTTAREIANQIVSQLFTPVLEDIKKVQAVKFPGRLPAKPITPNIPPTTAPQQKYQGEDIPESGGNIIDLRQK